MPYTSTIRGERFHFADLRELLAKANEPKSGDHLAGVAARTERERAAAKLALADVPLSEFLANHVIDPDGDDVSRLLLETHDAGAFAPIRSLTVGEFREFLLTEETNGATLASLRWGMLPEMAAAAAKLLSNKELVYV